MINSKRGGRLSISKYVTRQKTERKGDKSVERKRDQEQDRLRERESDTDGEIERLPLLFLQSVSSVSL